MSQEKEPIQVVEDYAEHLTYTVGAPVRYVQRLADALGLADHPTNTMLLAVGAGAVYGLYQGIKIGMGL